MILIDAPMLVLAAGCRSDAVCLQDDPPALVFYTRSAATGIRLDSVSGTVTSRGEINPFECGHAEGGPEVCEGWASGPAAIIHLARAGFTSWDTVGVAIDRTSGDCPRPILKALNVNLQPQ